MGSLSAGSVSLGVKPDANGFGSSLSKSILGDSAFSGLGKKMGGLIVGGLAAAGVGLSIAKVFSTGFKEASDASARTAQLTAGIEATGNAANVSIEGMSKYSDTLRDMSGQTGDSIATAQQLLLTFTNIKNVGPDKIFDQATLAATNMAAKMGGDASGQAILLGKALNDPVKGLTALTRVGVAFTQGQKDSIAAMVKTGDVAGAQKVILSELSTEFGGAAEAAGNSLPGQLARTKRSFEAISQSIVTGFMPIVMPAIAGVAAALQKATPFITTFSAALSEKLTAAVKAVTPVVHGLFDLFAKGNFTPSLGKALGIEEDSPVVGIILTIRDFVIDAFEKIKSSIGPVGAILAPMFVTLGTAFGPLIPQIIDLFSALSPIRLIFEAIGPMLPNLISDLVKLANSLGSELGGALVAMMPSLTSLVSTLATDLVAAVSVVLPMITGLVNFLAENQWVIWAVVGAWAAFTAVQVIGNVVSGASAIAMGVATAAQWALNLALDANPIGLIIVAIGAFVGALIWVATQTTFFQDTWKIVSEFFVDTWNNIASFFTTIWNGLMAWFNDSIAAVVGFVHDHWGLLLSFIIGPIGLAIQWVVDNWGGIVDFFQSTISTIGGAFGSVFDGIGGVIMGAFDGVVDFVRGIFNTIIGLVNGIIDGINGATSLGGAIGINIATIPHLPRLADGATILPRAGGTPVILGEAGKSETVVDTGKMNKMLDRANGSNAGGTWNIYETVSATATAMQVSRIQAAGAV